MDQYESDSARTLQIAPEAGTKPPMGYVMDHRTSCEHRVITCGKETVR
ncbi:MAG: hypothetical protein PHP38_08880 [Sphaerochaetaceae bacterium]|nr:hypothetical protein [Sphaerochaetaceae bacterium]MDD4763035.1 hypothetical protein [Sphaerochaetaceae bacterium]